MTTTTPLPSSPPPSPSAPSPPPPRPVSGPPVLLLDPGVLTDPADRERALVQLLRYQAQVRTAHVRLEEGDRVELLEPIRASWIDEDLAAEEYSEDGSAHENGQRMFAGLGGSRPGERVGMFTGFDSSLALQRLLPGVLDGQDRRVSKVAFHDEDHSAAPV